MSIKFFTVSARKVLFNCFLKKTINTLNSFQRNFCHTWIIRLLVLFTNCSGNLKVKSHKLYNNKYMVASTKITDAEILAFIDALVFTLLSRTVLSINIKK